MKLHWSTTLLALIAILVIDSHTNYGTSAEEVAVEDSAGELAYFDGDESPLVRNKRYTEEDTKEDTDENTSENKSSDESTSTTTRRTTTTTTRRPTTTTTRRSTTTSTTRRPKSTTTRRYKTTKRHHRKYKNHKNHKNYNHKDYSNEHSYYRRHHPRLQIVEEEYAPPAAAYPVVAGSEYLNGNEYEPKY